MSIAPYPTEDQNLKMQSVVPGSNKKKRRRLSFADDYDGGELTSVEHVDNLHYSKSASRMSDSSGLDRQQSGGCCLIS